MAGRRGSLPVRWRGLVVFSCLCLAAAGVCAQTNVWIDTDPSIGMALRDADDGFALIQAFRSPELRIRGISATYGNAPLKDTLAIARDLGRRFGSEGGVTEKDVFAGAANAGDLGRVTRATDALAGALTERRLTYLALGPLTDLATLVKRRPDLAERIERVVFIGGRLPGDRFYFGDRLPYEFHDANFEKDPLAVLTVLRTAIPIELVSVSASRKVLFTPTDTARLGRDGGAAGRFLETRSRSWLRLWRELCGLEGGPAFDSLAVLAVSHPDAFEDRVMRVCVSARLDRCQPVSPDGGREACYLLASEPELASSGSERMVVYHAATRAGAKEMILKALSNRESTGTGTPRK